MPRPNHAPDSPYSKPPPCTLVTRVNAGLRGACCWRLSGYVNIGPPRHSAQLTAAQRVSSKQPPASTAGAMRLVSVVRFCPTQPDASVRSRRLMSRIYKHVLWHRSHQATGATRCLRSHCSCGFSDGSYLVDPASSHMLVSKIKPCMS